MNKEVYIDYFLSAFSDSSGALVSWTPAVRSPKPHCAKLSERLLPDMTSFWEVLQPHLSLGLHDLFPEFLYCLSSVWPLSLGSLYVVWLSAWVLRDLTTPATAVGCVIWHPELTAKGTDRSTWKWREATFSSCEISANGKQMMGSQKPSFPRLLSQAGPWCGFANMSF